MVIKAGAILTPVSRREKTIAGALKLGAIFVRSEVAFAHAVAQLGDVVQLQHVGRFVHLATEIAFLDVEEEDFVLRRRRIRSDGGGGGGGR